MKNAAKARKSVGLTRSGPPTTNVCEIPAKLVVPVIKAALKIDSGIAGSMMEEIIISRLLPIPPKVDPASKAAKVMKNRAVAKR